MRFAILGPLEVRRGDDQVAIGGPQQRDLLAVLLVHAGRVVSTGRLIDYLWGERPPPRARGLLHSCVADLRRVLREGERQPLRTRSPGYVLELLPGELDADEFERLAGAAERAASAEDATRYLHGALGLWRGAALDGITVDALLPEAARLTERRWEVIEQRIEADLRTGRTAGLVAELRDRVREQPPRERLWLLLIRALEQAGRRADALAAYRELREALSDQLGVEPGPELQRLHRRILAAAEDADHSGSGTGSGTAGPGAVGPDLGAASASPPAQLPAAVAAFTGRDDHLIWLDELADDPETMVVAAITGGAGVGKTALAVRWAHRVRDRFPDGQLYVDLRGFAAVPPVRPLAALTGFLLALGVPAEQVPVQPAPATALYRSLLAGRRVLVMLDNAADPEQVRPLLPGSAGCLALVTSRDRLDGLVARDGARRLPLGLLSPDAAAQLLRRLLGDRVTAEPEATVELARCCAYLPLALRIAAADVSGGIAELVARLRADDRLDALAVDGDPDAAVRAAFDHSYGRLSPPARRLFRLLGAVPALDVTAPAAAALAGVPEADAAGLLRRLTAAHLLEPAGAGRFGCHDLLRSYATERARAQEPPDEREAAAARWFDWYVARTDAAARALNPDMLRLPPPGPAPPALDDHRAALAWLDAERPNLIAAVRYAADHGPAEAGWLLADALRGYLWTRAYQLDWLEVAGAGLAAAVAGGDRRGQAAAHLSLGDAYGRQDRHREALDHYRQALALHRETGWVDGESAALGNLGNVHWWAGELPAAAEHYRQALALAERTGRLAGQAVNVGNLGAVYWDMGELARAADCSRWALELDRRLGSPLGEAVDLTNLGRVELELGRWQAARVHLERSLGRHREIGNHSGEAEALRVLAETHLAAGEPEQAWRLAGQAAELARESGGARDEADARNTLGSCALRLGQAATAVAAHERALALATGGGLRYPRIVALTGLAAALPDPHRARLSARRAVALARRSGFRLLEGHALVALGRAQQRVGDQAGARTSLERARERLTACGSAAATAATR